MAKNWKKIGFFVLGILILLNIFIKLSRVSPFINQAKTIMIYDEKLEDNTKKENKKNNK